jgi:hypothetical protein
MVILCEEEYVHCVTARLAEKFMLGFQFDFDDG